MEEEEEGYNEEELEEEEEDGLEEREAGEAETEDLDDEDNQNRSESSDVICLDSDSEETNQYSSTRDNFSVSDVRKERVHKICQQNSVSYTHLDVYKRQPLYIKKKLSTGKQQIDKYKIKHLKCVIHTCYDNFIYLFFNKLNDLQTCIST